MAKPGPKPKRAANPKWTSELAYVCGLMASDGCLYSDGRHMNFTSNDIDQLNTFKKCLGLNNRISWKPSGSVQGKLHPQVQFSDVTLYKWFISIGITPRKSHTIGPIMIPDNYFFDYLRGEFDGDGSSHAYWDTRWHSSVSIYINFYSASTKHLSWLNNTIYRFLGISGIIGTKYASRACNLRFSKTKARVLYLAMYYSNSLQYLKRKKDKLDRQWEADQLSKLGKQPIGFKKGGSILRIA